MSRAGIRGAVALGAVAVGFAAPTVAAASPRTPAPAGTPATARTEVDPPTPSRDLLPRTIPAGPAATIAWHEGDRIRVASPGVPDRTVAWLRAGRDAESIPPSRPNGQPALSRDGSRLAVTGERGTWLVPITTGGKPMRIPSDNGFSESEVRWAADGRTLLVIGDDVSRCTVEPTLRCTTVARNIIREYGATISPDGASVASIRATAKAGGESLGNLVVTGPDGRSRVVERARRVGRRQVFPSPPVWTAAGLVWGVFEARDVNGDEPRYVRVRTRILRPDGSVHTLSAAAAPKDGSILPFVPFSGSPDGVTIGARVRLSHSGAVRQDLMTLAADGAFRDLGVSVGGSQERELIVLGVLADGRVAVREERSSADERLYLVAPGTKGLGPVVARGRAVDAAAAYPNDARSF